MRVESSVDPNVTVPMMNLYEGEYGVAEQLSMLFILPLIGLFLGQATGLILVNETLILWMAAGLVVVDAGLLYFSVQLFQRETILTRWK